MTVTPPAVRLSERQQAALLALADLQGPAYGDALAKRMNENGRETSLAAAHQAANGLDGKGLARKIYGRHAEPIRYEITDDGRETAALIRAETPAGVPDSVAGTPVPGRTGYVIGTCGCPVPEEEWEAGHRKCGGC